MDKINGINVTVADRAQPLFKSFKVVKSLSGGKTSISALSNDLIMQFPVLMSAGIDIDNAMVISKSLEQMIATMFLAVWTADASLSVSDYGMNGVRDFIRKYHNNSDIPDVIAYSGDILSLTDTLLGNTPVSEATIESIDIDPNMCQMTAEESALLWDSVEKRLSLESLNEMYTPVKYSINKKNQISEAIEGNLTDWDKSPILNGAKAFKATVAANKAAKQEIAPGVVDMGDSTAAIEPEEYTEPAPPASVSARVIAASNRVANNSINPKIGNWKEKTNTGLVDSKVASKSINEAHIVEYKNKLTNAAPTMIDVTFLVRGHDAGGRATVGEDSNRSVAVRQQRALVGVKTMVRFISSNYMVSNVVASIMDQSFAFKFVKWTKGEMKVGRDMILGISRIKQDATAANKADMWFAALRKRKRAAKTFKFSNTGINPFTTLILTTDEVEQIKQTSGYDVLDMGTTKLIMDNLFLLCFMVVDTTTGMVEYIMDGNSRFSATTLKNMKSGLSKDEVDLADQAREMRKLMGRF